MREFIAVEGSERALCVSESLLRSQAQPAPRLLEGACAVCSNSVQHYAQAETLN
jgi:hypothetical protein